MDIGVKVREEEGRRRTFVIDPSRSVRINISNHVVNILFSQVITKALQNPSKNKVMTSSRETPYGIPSRVPCLTAVR